MKIKVTLAVFCADEKVKKYLGQVAEKILVGVKSLRNDLADY